MASLQTTPKLFVEVGRLESFGWYPAMTSDINIYMIFTSVFRLIKKQIQLSEEMWNFDDDGQLFFEKAVNSFLRVIFLDV